MQTFDEILPAIAGDEASTVGPMSELAGVLSEATDEDLAALVDAANAGHPGMDEAISELNETPADEAAETPDEQAAEDDAGLEVHAVEEAEPELTEEEQAAADEEASAAALATASDSNDAAMAELKNINKGLQHQAIEAAHLDDAEVAEAATTLVDELIEKVGELLDEANGLMKDSAAALKDGDTEGLEKVFARLTEILVDAHEAKGKATAAVQPVDRGGAAAADDGGPSDMELWAKSAQ